MDNIISTTEEIQISGDENFDNIFKKYEELEEKIEQRLIKIKQKKVIKK